MEEARSLQEQLFRSICFSEIDQTKKILTEHPELINAKGCEGWTQGVYTPLVDACRFVQHEAATFLLDNGADVSATGHFYSTPNIYGKSRKGGFGSRDDIFPLFVAVDRQMGHSIFNIHTVNALLSAGANTNQRTAIGQTALHVLCTTYSKDTFREFSLDDDDDTNFKMQIMRILIDHGADVNICDHQGKSPLHYACLHGNRDLTKILLRKGADVYQEDEDGLTALDYAAAKDYHLTTALIDKYSFPITHIIRAYECVAFRATHPSEMLRKAALLREAYGFPKNVLSPVESFDFEKEWETIGEQEKYEDDSTRVYLQCLLARERIAIENNFDIPQDILDISILYRIWTSDQHQQIRFPSFNSLLTCRLDQFFYFEKYIYFTDLINNKVGISLSNAVEIGCPLSTDVLVKYAQAAIESCFAIQSKLNFEGKPSCAYELKNDMIFILYFIGGVILHLIKRSVNGFSQECEDDGPTRMTGNNVMHRVAKVVCDELLNRCPSVSAPYFGYSWPVAHLLNRKDFIFGRFVGGLHQMDLAGYCFKYNQQLLKMIADAQYDINATDWEGNTLLHIVMFKLYESTHLLEMVKVLLENGAYPHGKNKQGKCPANELHEIQRRKPENNIISSIKGLLMKHDCTLALKCLTARKIIDSKIPYYSKQLPKALVKFVNSH